MSNIRKWAHQVKSWINNTNIVVWRNRNCVSKDLHAFYYTSSFLTYSFTPFFFTASTAKWLRSKTSNKHEKKWRRLGDIAAAAGIWDELMMCGINVSQDGNSSIPRFFWWLKFLHFLLSLVSNESRVEHKERSKRRRTFFRSWISISLRCFPFLFRFHTTTKSGDEEVEWKFFEEISSSSASDSQLEPSKNAEKTWIFFITSSIFLLHFFVFSSLCFLVL